LIVAFLGITCLFIPFILNPQLITARPALFTLFSLVEPILFLFYGGKMILIFKNSQSTESKKALKKVI